MALKSNKNDAEQMVHEKLEEVDEIKAVDEQCESNGHVNGNKDTTEGNEYKECRFRLLDRKSIGKRCRLFIQGGQQRGKQLLGRSKGISKGFSCHLVGARSNSYLVGGGGNPCYNIPCAKSKSTTKSSNLRARRSRLAEDALF